MANAAEKGYHSGQTSLNVPHVSNVEDWKKIGQDYKRLGQAVDKTVEVATEGTLFVTTAGTGYAVKKIAYKSAEYAAKQTVKNITINAIKSAGNHSFAAQATKGGQRFTLLFQKELLNTYASQIMLQGGLQSI